MRALRTLGFAGLLLSIGRLALACECKPHLPVPEAFAASDLVALARVVNVADQNTWWRRLKDRLLPRPAEPTDMHSYYGRYGLDVTLEIRAAWKGPAKGTLHVFTGSGAGDCGFRFQPGATYLLYATAGNGFLTTSICHRTAPAATAGDDVQTLDRLTSRLSATSAP